jgi:MFS family permease
VSAVAAYRELLRIVGPAYVLVAFLGRVPLAMSQMGTLLLVSDATGRYAYGGAAAGVLAVANAVGAPFWGALADRHGQRGTVLVQSLAGAAGLLALVAVADAEPWVPIAVAGVAGLFVPQVGPLARVRWRPIAEGATRDRRDDAARRRTLVDAAFSYEGAADEASFVLGPALIGVLAFVAEPSLALLVGAGLLAVFGTLFAVHPTAALTKVDRGAAAVSGRLITTAFVLLVLAQAWVGVLFGSVQTGTTALTTAAGEPGVAGIVHAVLGVGSVAAGLTMAAVPERVGYATRSLVAAVALTVLAAPLLLVDTIGQLVLVVLLLGCAVAPYMISNFALAGHLVPENRVGAAMTLLAGATGIGYALGSSVAGRLADDHGHTGAFVVPVVTAALAVLTALAQRSRSRRSSA